MIEITKDKKSPTWIITKTDSEGFHHQLSVTIDELEELAFKAKIELQRHKNASIQVSCRDDLRIIKFSEE